MKKKAGGGGGGVVNSLCVNSQTDHETSLHNVIR